MKRLVFNPFVLLLVYWSVFNSKSNNSPTSCSFGDRLEQDYCVFIDTEDDLDLIEASFQCLEEENSTERNDESRAGGNVFDHAQDSQRKWSFSYSELLRTAYTAISSPVNARPLYLLIRVFRI